MTTVATMIYIHPSFSDLNLNHLNLILEEEEEGDAKVKSYKQPCGCQLFISKKRTQMILCQRCYDSETRCIKEDVSQESVKKIHRLLRK